MEHKIHPIEKENHLPNHHFQVLCWSSGVHLGRKCHPLLLQLKYTKSPTGHWVAGLPTQGRTFYFVGGTCWILNPPCAKIYHTLSVWVCICLRGVKKSSTKIVREQKPLLGDSRIVTFWSPDVGGHLWTSQKWSPAELVVPLKGSSQLVSGEYAPFISHLGHLKGEQAYLGDLGSPWLLSTTYNCHGMILQAVCYTGS